MTVSVYVLESRQVGDIWNHEPKTWWQSISVRLDTLILNFCFCWVKIFQNVTQNQLSQNYINLLHFLLFQICLLSLTMCREFPSDECKNKIRLFKHENLVLIFWNFLILCTNLKSYLHSPESENTIWSNPTLLWAADFSWPSIDAHSPKVSFFAWLYTARQVHRDIWLVL